MMGKNNPNPTDSKDKPENEDGLMCVKDYEKVSSENPKCMHPSSYCPHREFCPVIEAMKEKENKSGD